MGKTGKLRKKRKLEVVAVANHEVYEEEEDDRGNDEQGFLESDMMNATTLFQFLANYTTHYHDKQLKPLRTAYFPLFNAQKDKFFRRLVCF